MTWPPFADRTLIKYNVPIQGAKIEIVKYFSPFIHFCRAQIYRESGDVTMAIVNFTQAIKLDPEDYEAYYQRAEMYEKVSRVFWDHLCLCRVGSYCII